MKKTLLLALALALSAAPLRAVEAVSPAASAGPALVGAPAPDFHLTAPQVAASYEQARTDLDAALSPILAVPAARRTFDNTVRALETATAVFNEKAAALSFLGYVSPDAQVREAAQAVETQSGQDTVALWARPQLYAAVKAFADGKPKLQGADARLLETMLRAFKQAGHGLDPEKKARLEAVQKRLAELATQFEANINADDSRIDMTPEQLQGVPESVVERLEAVEGGKRRVTVKDPDYGPYMSYAVDSGMRKRLQLLRNTRAAEKNLPILRETLQLRDESAKLLGYPGFPDLALDGRMAQTPQKVWDFLDKLWPILRRRGDKELSELLEVKRRDQPQASAVTSDELAFYSEKLRRERFDLDAEEVKKYFPVERVIDGTMRVYERVLGVKFAPQPADSAWNPDVKLLRVDDAKTGEELGYFYLDLVPREGKYPHAAAFQLVSGRELPGGGYRKPYSAMVANFPKGAPGKPALMPHEDVETFFHEFGHLMHQTLTKARYASQSGSNVAQDFVEAPSQMLENFVWRREVLDEISGRWDAPSQKLPDELFQKMTAARSFNRGVDYLRQLAYAMMDMTFHTAVPLDTTRLFNQLMELVGMVPQQPGMKQEASFGHLLGGYGAGYYGYLWSEVFADDIFSRFIKEGLFNPAVGMAWRREVLEMGSSRPELDSLKAFLGREPSENAFMDKLEGAAQGPSAPAALPERTVPAAPLSRVPPVSRAFLEAAKAAGLAEPLAGVADARLADPARLLAQGWTSREAPGGEWDQYELIVYSFAKDGKVLQTCAVDKHTGRPVSLFTYDRAGANPRMEVVDPGFGKRGRRTARAVSRAELAQEDAWLARK